MPALTTSWSVPSVWPLLWLPKLLLQNTNTFILFFLVLLLFSFSAPLLPAGLPVTFSSCHYLLVAFHLTCNYCWFIDILWPARVLLKTYHSILFGWSHALMDFLNLNFIFWPVVAFFPIYSREIVAFDNSVMMQTRLYGWQQMGATVRHTDGLNVLANRQTSKRHQVIDIKT